MPEVNMTELKDLYGQICVCRDCQLPQGFCPQLRPPGPNYKPGGVAFVQINPGQVGSLSDEKIANYRTENARDIATRKAADTRRLVSLQEQFVKNPNDATYERMRAAFFTSMSELWGWPPGKYRSTIEAHAIRSTQDHISIARVLQEQFRTDAQLRIGRQPPAQIRRLRVRRHRESCQLQLSGPTVWTTPRTD